MLRSTFELLQEPMRFVLVLRSTFELLQEPMRFVLVYAARLSFCRTNEVRSCVTQHV